MQGENRQETEEVSTLYNMLKGSSALGKVQNRARGMRLCGGVGSATFWKEVFRVGVLSKLTFEQNLRSW